MPLAQSTARSRPVADAHRAHRPLAIVAALVPAASGYAGASRHAITVGFFAAAVFTIGPRILPAYINVRRRWSTRMMAASLLLPSIGCAARVVSQSSPVSI